MPLQLSRGLVEIRFAIALAHFCTLMVAAVGATPLAAESVTEHLASIGSTASVAAESDILPVAQKGTRGEAEATLAQLPNRGQNRQEIPVPNPILPTPPPLPEPALPAPLPSPEQLLQPTAPALTQTEELLNIPGAVSFGLNRTRSNIIEPPFDALDIEAAGRTYELTYRQPIVQTPRREIAIGIGAGRRESNTSLLGEDFPLSPGSDSRGRTRVSVLRAFQDFTQRGERRVFAARSQFSLGVRAFDDTASNNEPDSQFLAWRGQLQYVRLLAKETLLVVRSDLQLAGEELLPIEQLSAGLGLRWLYGDKWSARLGWGIPLIDIKSSDRSLQERGLYFSVEFKPF